MHSFRLRAVAAPIAVSLLLALTLVGCNKDKDPETAPADPVSAVNALVDALHDSDLARFSKLSVPAPLHAQMEARWEQKAATAPEPSAADKQKFADTMAKLTAADAEQVMYAELEPQLAKMEGEMAAQMPMLVGMGGGFVNAGIQSNETLTPAQKAHASAVVGALSSWAMTAPFTDRAKAKQAIAVITTAARKANVKTLDDIKGLAMQPALEKGGLVFAAAKDMLAVYGLDANAALAGVKAEKVSETGDQAVVKVTYMLGDKPISFEIPMQRRDGAWYSSEAIASAEKELAAPLTAPATTGDDAAVDADADAVDADADADAATASS